MVLREKTSLQKLPTLTEIFFGKGINPATDKPYVVKETRVTSETSKKNGMSKKKLLK